MPNVAPSDPAEGVIVERGFVILALGLNEAVEFFS